ncbi:metallophosphoesterase [Erysipelotrichaceae bacterium HCN-30851]
MVRKLLKIVSVLICIALVIAGIFFYSIYISVDRVSLSYETISSNKIPESMNDITIAFISDIKYNEFMDKTRLSNMISKLTTTSPDIVIFGGDMFSEPDKNVPDSQMSKDITTILKSIEAPLGKFAILGDQDNVNEDVKKIVSQILYDSDFEVLSDSAIRLRNENSDSISLIGLNNLINGDPKPENAMKNVNENEFNILVTHCPDAVSKSGINLEYIDIALAGHSLGGQIYLPVLGPIYTEEGATTYNRGQYDINGSKLYVSNGLGTSKIDMRLMTPPQVLIFRLQHTSKSES